MYRMGGLICGMCITKVVQTEQTLAGAHMEIICFQVIRQAAVLFSNVEVSTIVDS
jgi:hypothetical protein